MRASRETLETGVPNARCCQRPEHLNAGSLLPLLPVTASRIHGCRVAPPGNVRRCRSRQRYRRCTFCCPSLGGPDVGARNPRSDIIPAAKQLTADWDGLKGAAQEASARSLGGRALPDPRRRFSTGRPVRPAGCRGRRWRRRRRIAPTPSEARCGCRHARSCPRPRGRHTGCNHPPSGADAAGAPGG
jgi:hypothetical protein